MCDSCLVPLLKSWRWPLQTVLLIGTGASAETEVYLIWGDSYYNESTLMLVDVLSNLKTHRLKTTEIKPSLQPC